MKKLFNPIILIILVNLILASGQLYLTTQRSVDGVQVASLQKQVELLVSQNHNLSSSIFRLSSISYIYQTAAQSELVPVKFRFVSPVSLAAAPFTP